MRRQHPTWGAGIIRVILTEQHPGRVLPSERTVQRAFVRAGLNPAPAGRRGPGPDRRAERPHETWQVDAADQMDLADGRQASWLRIVDECTGAVLETAVFPPRVLHTRAGRARPRRPSAGASYGGGCRNGSGWTTARRGGRKGDLPTGLEFWLAGLEVEVQANPPRRPQDNGVVERSQGTGKRWSEPHRAALGGGSAD